MGKSLLAVCLAVAASGAAAADVRSTALAANAPSVPSSTSAPTSAIHEIDHAADHAVAARTEARLGDGPLLALARLAGRFDLHVFAPGVVDRLVHWQLSARDLIHSAVDRLASVSTELAASIAPPPDVSVLTSDPLASMRTHESSGFGWRDDPIHHDTRYHSGTDFRSKPGTPVLAAGDGIVTFCGRQGGYGNVIYVDHGGGVTTRYAHLSRIEVKKDETLTAGEEIGKVGSTGRATGPHLHFEVRIDGHAVSPILAMQVADLERTDPASARVAAYALSPELAAHALADVDHPRSAPPGTRARPGKTEARPDRPGRVKRPVAQS